MATAATIRGPSSGTHRPNVVMTHMSRYRMRLPHPRVRAQSVRTAVTALLIWIRTEQDAGNIALSVYL